MSHTPIRVALSSESVPPSRSMTWLVVLTVATLVALLASCGSPVAPTQPPPLGVPVIESFTAVPSDIEVGEVSTLAWVVTGEGVTVSVEDDAGVIVSGDGADVLDASVDVQPSVTTTYTLTAASDGGVVTEGVTVTVHAPPPDLSGLAADTLTGSRLELTWSVSGASTIEIYAAASSAPNAAADLLATLGGGVTSHTMPIPASDRQTVRVCALGLGGAQTCLSTGLTNVVTSASDYDPYFLEGFTPEPAIPGSLRAVIEDAAPGAVIGFASDITQILVRGVDLLQLPSVGWRDAHLILNKDVTISGPVGAPVTLEGASAWSEGDPGDPFTYRSRMIYVVEGSTVALENLVITGGTFIYKGGGIRNDGTLTVSDSIITANRAWDVGGGIWNNTTGDLIVQNSQIIDNEAVTTDSELAQGTFSIRGGFEISMFPAGQGGGLYNEPGGTLTLINSTVQQNESRFKGGGLFVAAGGSASVSGTSISGNEAGETGSGGGIHHVYAPGDIGSLALSSVDLSANVPLDLVQVEVGAGGTSVSPSSRRPFVPDR